MKRLILLALVLATIFCNGGFAEEGKELHTHEYKGSWIVPNLYEIADGIMKELTAVRLYTFDTSEKKQPLIFEGTEENPKTGFSYMSIEEISQLPDDEILVTYYYDGDKVSGSEYKKTLLKNVLLGIENLFEYKKQKDESLKKVLRIKILKRTAKPTPYYSFSLTVGSGDNRILYEQLCYIFIEYFVPYTVVNTTVEGSTIEKINKMYLGNTPAQELNLLYWIPNKPAKRIEADKAYIQEALLNVKEEDFDQVLGYLQEQFYRYIYIDINGQAYIGTAAPTSSIKKMYGIK